MIDQGHNRRIKKGIGNNGRQQPEQTVSLRKRKNCQQQAADRKEKNASILLGCIRQGAPKWCCQQQHQWRDTRKKTNLARRQTDLLIIKRQKGHQRRHRRKITKIKQLGNDQRLWLPFGLDVNHDFLFRWYVCVKNCQCSFCLISRRIYTAKCCLSI